MTLQLGILLALLCAIASNLSFFFKHRGAREAPAVDVRHPWRTAKALYSSRWFSIGMIVGGGAWALHVAAISLVPLSVVQVVLSGGVVLIAIAFQTNAPAGVDSRLPLPAASTRPKKRRALP